MEFKKVIFAGALALTLGACSSTTASSKAASSAKDSASSASSATEEVETKGSYKVTNLTGEKITGLYYYETGVEQQLNIRNSTHDNQIKYENNRKVMLRI